MRRSWNPYGWMLPMFGRRTVTRFGRDNLSHAEQVRRIVAARAKRLRRRERNAVLTHGMNNDVAGMRRFIEGFAE